MRQFTDMERAIMEGGHDLNDLYKTTAKGATFIQELSEAKMFKTREQIAREGTRSLSNHLMMGLITLYVLGSEYEYAPVASTYAKRTTGLGNFNRPSPGGTDLYQTIYSLKRPELFGGPKDKMMMDKIRIDDTKLKSFLNSVGTERANPTMASQALLKFERDLAITDPKLRAARRLAQDWPNLNTDQRKLVATQMMRYYRLNGRRSDLMPLFGSFVKDNKLTATNSVKSRIAKKVAKDATAFAAGYAIGRNLEV